MIYLFFDLVCSKKINFFKNSGLLKEKLNKIGLIPYYKIMNILCKKIWLFATMV